jgi:hypothetical protein
MHNHDIVFDNENKRIGLVSSECDKVDKFDIIEKKFRPNSDFNFGATCDREIRYLRTVCILTTILIVIIVVLFFYAIRKLRREGKFLWISLNEDIESNSQGDVKVVVS